MEVETKTQGATYKSNSKENLHITKFLLISDVYSGRERPNFLQVIEVS